MCVMLAQHSNLYTQTCTLDNEFPMTPAQGWPVAAVVIFRACYIWQSYQADSTTIFNRVVTVISAQVDEKHDDNACQAYWYISVDLLCCAVPYCRVLCSLISNAAGDTVISASVDKRLHFCLAYCCGP